ncbi:MAG: peptidase S41 [Anaerolineae bacterium]|nr:peptidase S41 [Anaerolineae bacterium]
MDYDKTAVEELDVVGENGNEGRENAASQVVSAPDAMLELEASMGAPVGEPGIEEQAAAKDDGHADNDHAEGEAQAKPRRKPRKRPVKSILGTTVMLDDFLLEADERQFDIRDRARVVDQAQLLLEQLYVHLPLKRAMHAVDPVQRLKLLRRRLGTLSELQFSREMLSIFTELRDLHTNYLLPDPFRNRTALLPFLIEEFYEDGTRKYMVSHVVQGFRHSWFKPGVVVTHWNGTPIERAVELNAENQMGSNPEARHARGVEAMTIRPLMMSIPPDEEWVMVRYLAKEEPHDIRFQWRVLVPTYAPESLDPNSIGEIASYGLGYDALTETARRVKKTLFAPKALETEQRMSALNDMRVSSDMRQTNTAPAASQQPKGADERAAARELKKHSTLPDIFAFRTVETPHGEFGYIRLWTFMVNDDVSFVDEFIRIVEMLPQNGLIIDVRANGGGLITAGERLLQVLTPRTIEPCRMQFINTPLTQFLCEKIEWLSPWHDSIEQAVETGSAFSYGFPIKPAEENNTLGQRYYGPVVLIVDALCYSTTDIFAAGFQDHNIGKILGSSGNMGAGGANVWTHELLRHLVPGPHSPFRELPNNASFRVAVRRTTRIGERSGVPVEGLGVTPDELHHMTANDLLNKNEDLINRAAQLLAEMRAQTLDVKFLARENGTVKLTVTTKNIERLDMWVGGRPQSSLDVGDGKTMLAVALGKRAKRIEVRGFANEELVAVKKFTVGAEEIG